MAVSLGTVLALTHQDPVGQAVARPGHGHRHVHSMCICELHWFVLFRGAFAPLYQTSVSIKLIGVKPLALKHIH